LPIKQNNTVNTPCFHRGGAYHSGSDSDMDEENNIFDEDHALDYIMSEEVEKDSGQSQNKSGCLGHF